MFDTLRESVEEIDDAEEVGRAYDPDMPYGDVDYADPGYQDDEKKRYPLDSEEHCRAAWSYINMPKNAAKYSPDELAKVKGRIKAALKEYGVEVEDDTKRAECCPDCLDGESHVFRREWTLDGIDIIRSGSGGDGRTVEAYATVFDSPTEVKDQHGHYMETIDRAAFDEVLRSGIGKVKVFYNHGMDLHGRPSDMWSVPIGVPLDVRADGKGLRTVTRFNEGADGDRILEAIRNQAITGYSFRGPIRQSNPPRIPRAKDGHPLPTVTRTKLGLTEYGPTPTPYYVGASILALRSRLSTLDDSKWDRLVELLSTSTPEDQEALRTELSATPTEGPGAEDQPQALRSAADIARRIRVEQILRSIPSGPPA